jgi:chromosome segregation ATPase
MLGIGKYLTGGLGIGIVALGIVCTVQCNMNAAQRTKISGLNDKLDAETTKTKECAADMTELRAKVDAKNAEVLRLQAKGVASQAVQAEADRLARQLAKAERQLAAIAVERDTFEARLAGLSRCDKYLVTLLAFAGWDRP